MGHSACAHGAVAIAPTVSEQQCVHKQALIPCLATVDDTCRRCLNPQGGFVPSLRLSTSKSRPSQQHLGKKLLEGDLSLCLLAVCVAAVASVDSRLWVCSTLQLQ